ncbi:MAG: hypothetical protein ABIQ62_10040 [Thermomonas sp.]
MTAQGNMGRRRRAALWVALAVVVVALLAWLGLRGQDPQPREQPTQVESKAPAAVAVAGPSPRPQPGQAGKSLATKPCMDDLQRVMRKRTRELAQRGDARSQLAYALTSNMLQPERPDHATAEDAARLSGEQRKIAMQAFARARALDPSHPDVAWLAAEQCFDGPECAGVQQALLANEPDNMAVWLRAMAWARARNDDAAVDAAFKRAASAQHYDMHHGSTLLALMEGYAGLPNPASCKLAGVQEALRKQVPAGRELDIALWVEILGLAGEQASVIVGAPLNQVCAAEVAGALATQRQADCIHIYSAMAGGDTIVEQMIAVVQLIRLTREAPEAMQWREHYRQLRWIMEQRGGGVPPMDLVDLATNEMAAMQQALRAAGRWPAPEGWLPRDAWTRSLIETGHYPAP